jgi:hypothetical protein
MLGPIVSNGWFKVGVGVLVGAAVTGSLAVAQGATSLAAGANTVTACVNDGTGAVTVLSDPTGYFAGSSCTDGSHLLSWNQQGLPGVQGPQGVTGPQGPTGLQGATGAGGLAPPVVASIETELKQTQARTQALLEAAEANMRQALQDAQACAAPDTLCSDSDLAEEGVNELEQESSAFTKAEQTLSNLEQSQADTTEAEVQNLKN